MKYFIVAAPTIIVLLLCVSLGLFVKLQHERQVNAMLVEQQIQGDDALRHCFVYAQTLDTPHNNESPTDPTPSGRKQ